VADYNGPRTEGVSYAQHTVVGTRRVSAWSAFVQPVARAGCLTVASGALVTRLLFSGRRCVGVAYTQKGRRFEAYADADVVLAAGAIGSPQILLISGVGPPDGLRRLGIDPVADLPGVGADLHDHVKCPVAWDSWPYREPEGQCAEAHLMWRSNSALALPDVLPLFLAAPLAIDGQERSESGFTCRAVVTNVHSRGRLWLRSADPAVHPVLDPALYSDDRDLEAMVDCLEIIRDIGRHDPLRSWTKREIVPGPQVRTRAQLRAFARKQAGSPHHQAGTCRMGMDADAVVDPLLQVHGVTNLRVADMSIAPAVPRGNTNAPAIMIGERAADFILHAAP
jgi:choline dehydrogenase